jgi:hypothetical protein
VIAHFDWLPGPGNVVEATECLIEAHNPDWKLAGGMGMYPWWLRDVEAAGFHQIETFSYDVDVEYAPEAWRGRIRASAGVGASLPPDGVEAFDRALQRSRTASSRSSAGRPHRTPEPAAGHPPRTGVRP